MRTFSIVILCAPLSGMEPVASNGQSIPSLQSLVARSLYREFSSSDAERRYSEQEVFDLMAHLKAHSAWDLVAREIPRDSSGEEKYWKAERTPLVPRAVARLAPCLLYYESATGFLRYQFGDGVRLLDGLSTHNPQSWVLSDDGACAVGYGSYAGHDGLIYAELVGGGVYPLELPTLERFVHAFIPTTQTLQILGKSGLYEAPLSMLFQQGRGAWRIRMHNPGSSGERIIPLSPEQTILGAPHLLKSGNRHMRPPEGSSIEQATVFLPTNALSYITRQSVRARRSQGACLWMMDTSGERWNTEVDAAFPVSMAFSPDGRLIAVVTSQGNLALYTSTHGELFATIEGLAAQHVLWSAHYFGVHGFGKGHRLTPTFAHYAAYCAQKQIQNKERLRSQKSRSGQRSRSLTKADLI